MSKYHNTKTPDDQRDYWRTPVQFFNFAKIQFFNFDVDLACNTNNSLCDLGLYHDCGVDSLGEEWIDWGRYGWCNPPYSKIKPWLEKAIDQRDKGFSSVFLIPTPNGESRDQIIVEESNQLVYIQGRVPFISSVTGKPASGSFRGSCFVVFDQSRERRLPIVVSRDFIIQNY